MSIVLVTAVFALILAFVLGTALGFFRELFAVPQNPLTGKIREALPGANCGACGFPGCDNYAQAIAEGKADINACTVGGAPVAEKLADITGMASQGSARQVAVVLSCQGSYLHAPQKGKYTGFESCRGAKLATGSTKLCTWSCLGFGDCVKMCKFDALSMDSVKGLPVIDYTKCTGCGMCIGECPQSLLKSVYKDQKGAIVLCANRNPVKQGIVKSCKIACIKCGLCVKQCPQQCIDLSTHIPVVDLSKCNSCGTCVEKCPTKVIKIIEKDLWRTRS
jgi:Na+-translocating ferredoxin:NAD+ oxidoreductase RNF subunit RnfB